MTIQLPEDLAVSVRAELTSGRFPSEEALVAEAVRAFLDQRQPSAAPPDEVQPMHPSFKPFWERALELTADIPEEEWDKVPTDLAEQHDHYIYGTPKRPTS